MPRRLRVLVILALVLSGAAAAQAAGPRPAGRVYRLEQARSSVQVGCFPPCLCPGLDQRPLRGVFTLTPTGFDGLYDTFVVSDVVWIGSVGNAEWRFTGSGRFVIGGEFALEQRLELDLVVDGGVAEHFDSGFVPADAAQFPALHLSVSLNHMFCHDTVLTIDAAPLRPSRMLRYRLVAPTTFQQGCGLEPSSSQEPACECRAGRALPMRGSFRLVPLSPGPLFDEFAVVDVRWRAASARPPGSGEAIAITGAGLYRVGGEFAVMQQLQLELVIDGDDRVHLDSGLTLGGGEFPSRIAARATSGACYQRRLDLHAAQAPPLARLGVR